MKEIKVNTTIVEFKWEAIDKTQFPSKEECQRYEQTARCVIRSKIKDLIVSDDNDAWTLLGGYDDHTITVLKPKHAEDVKNIKQFFLLECPWYLDDERKELREQIFKTIDKTLLNNDVILFGLNCDGDYYFINSRQNIIDNLNALDKS